MLSKIIKHSCVRSKKEGRGGEENRGREGEGERGVAVNGGCIFEIKHDEFEGSWFVNMRAVVWVAGVQGRCWCRERYKGEIESRAGFR